MPPLHSSSGLARVAFVLLVGIALVGVPAHARAQTSRGSAPPAGTPRQKSVLLLDQLRRDAPNSISTDEIHRRVLQEAFGSRLDYYSEYVDVVRFGDPQYRSALRTYLRTRYAGQRLDLVIATTTAALELVGRDKDDLFPDVPIVFHGGIGLSGGAHSTGVVSAVHLADTVAIAHALQPDRNRLVVVNGASALDRRYGDLAKAQLKPFEDRLTIEYLDGLPMADLERTVRELPGDSMIFFIMIYEDGVGERMLALDALDRLSAVARVPLYSWHEGTLGHGTIGGRLFSSNTVANRTAELAVRVLKGEDPEQIPVARIDPYVLHFDSRELRRWGISERRLPAGSVVLFKEPSAWIRYRGPIVAAILIGLLQTAFIVGLIAQRIRRRSAEDALRLKEAQLRRSYESIQDLAGRLLTAQEAERSRIARDLHDDIGQEVASVSMGLSRLRRRDDLGDSELKTTVASLYQRVVGLGEVIRALSHDLHPSSLEHIGLKAALEAHCIEVEEQHDIQVTCRAADVGPLAGARALGLYRIAQEALRNTSRHADARRVTVTLDRVDEQIELVITDDGRGFDAASNQLGRGGIGLVSIDERARLLGGSAQVTTRIGSGVTVRVCIPATGAPVPPSVLDEPSSNTGAITA